VHKLIFASTTGSALIALALSLSASAFAAPSGVGSAQDTVNSLENSGYKVVLNKLGPAPLHRCTVDSVRPGETVTRPVPSGNEIVYQTVYLTAKC
jgi:hypothetical protein